MAGTGCCLQWRVSRILRVLLTGVGVALLLSPWTSRASGPSSMASTPAGPIRVLSSTPQALILEFTLPGYTLSPVLSDGQTYLQMRVPGLLTPGKPGSPQLPSTGLLVGLPAQGMPRLSVLEADSAHLSLKYRLCAQPAPQPMRQVDGSTSTGAGHEFILDEALYHSDTLYPANIAEIAEVAWLRDQRVARVALHPVRYNPARGQVEVIRHMLVRLDWPEAVPSPEAKDPQYAPVPALEQTLKGALLNYEVARSWRAEPPLRMPPLRRSDASVNALATSSGSFKVVVADDGLYRLTYADLQAAGLPINTLDPRRLQLFEGGSEVSIAVDGQADGRFDEGDSLLFYGRVLPSRYSRQGVYWLRHGEVSGVRMSARQTVSGTVPAGVLRSTTRWEQNHYYDALFPAADGDHWYAADLRPEIGYTATLRLPPLSAALTATLRVGLVGYTANPDAHPDHHAVVAVNGRPVGEWWWDSEAPVVTATLPLGPDVLSSLNAGDNAITVSLPGIRAPAQGDPIVEGAWLDAIELDYAPLGASAGSNAVSLRGQAGARRYTLGGLASPVRWLCDTTDPRRPVLLQGYEMVGPSNASYTLRFDDAPAHNPSYLVVTDGGVRGPVSVEADTPSNLRDATHGADYLIITHADFAGALLPLAAHRRAQGLRVVAVDVQDVYDEFSAGRLDPEAIRSFIAYASAQWSKPAPSYVLLVGDGSYDFLDYSGYGSRNYIPPYLQMVNPIWGETAADNRYVMLDDDLLPDLMLGRLPVSSPAEAATVVQKIVDYERSPLAGDWNKRHVFVADVADPDEGDFAAWTDSVYNEFVAGLQSGWSGKRIYLDDLPGTVAREGTLAAWNQGAILMSYVGHSSWHQWASISVAETSAGSVRYVPLFHLNDVAGLHNGGRLPVVLEMTCFTGFFHHPQYRTLDESLLGHAGGGAVATWSPSGLGLAEGHYFLHRAFYQEALGTDKIQLGAATWAAKVRLFSQVGGDGTYADLFDTYHLFGDPAMALDLVAQPCSGRVYLPMVNK